MSAPLVLGIAGGTGSGKTTIALALVEELGASAVRIDHDSYYKDQSHLSDEERAQINYDHPDSLDNDLLATLISERFSRITEVEAYDGERDLAVHREAVGLVGA